MNIHGLKLKLKPITQQIKKGRRELGTARYNKLVDKRTRINNKIKKLREERKNNQKKK